MIIGIVAGALVLIAIGVVVFIIIKKRKRNKDTSQVALKVGDVKDMQTTYNTKTHKVIKQDLPAGANEVNDDEVGSEQR